jgi:ADP-ribose pyrophosphatase
MGEDNDWEVISSETHFANKNLEVMTEEVRTPARRTPRAWTVVHRKTAVVIAPMTRDGRIILIRQERIPIRAAIWEMPAGQIDDATELDEKAIATVALREMREETGFNLASDGEMTPLGYFFSSPGFTDERGYFFLAHPVEQTAEGPAHDESESILGCQSFSREEISRMISENEIRDANTLSLCVRLVAHGFLALNPATPAR